MVAWLFAPAQTTVRGKLALPRAEARKTKKMGASEVKPAGMRTKAPSVMNAVFRATKAF